MSRRRICESAFYIPRNRVDSADDGAEIAKYLAIYPSSAIVSPLW